MRVAVDKKDQKRPADQIKNIQNNCMEISMTGAENPARDKERSRGQQRGRKAKKR